MIAQAEQLTLIVDAEFKSLIPPLADGELALLEANILADGCREPLVLWLGTLIDGHNRHEICTKHDIEFRTVEKNDLASRDDVLIWIINNQRGRRNIAEIDRIKLTAKLESILAGRAAKNLKTPTGGLTLAKLPKSQVPVNTRHESAVAADVGDRTYAAGKMVLAAVENGEIEPEVVDDIRRGRLAIHGVAKGIKEKRQQKARKEKRMEAAKESPALDEPNRSFLSLEMAQLAQTTSRPPHTIRTGLLCHPSRHPKAFLPPDPLAQSAE
jgi:hypothetical protein